ncbi:hypothetical protein [Nocardia abscessus]|uniref:hypothetical protein n=1 Tax=Nocardia abscessus TaxID=120957 RepID=UPI002457324F|nr:hypothetical protein [Nocardia abscessus]
MCDLNLLRGIGNAATDSCPEEHTLCRQHQSWVLGDEPGGLSQHDQHQVALGEFHPHLRLGTIGDHLRDTARRRQRHIDDHLSQQRSRDADDDVLLVLDGRGVVVQLLGHGVVELDLALGMGDDLAVLLPYLRTGRTLDRLLQLLRRRSLPGQHRDQPVRRVRPGIGAAPHRLRIPLREMPQHQIGQPLGEIVRNLHH